MRILTIFLRHGLARYAEAEARLDGLLRHQLPDVERDLLVVDNALPSATTDGGTLAGRSTDATEVRRVLIGGDNRVREFTGFDRAVDWIGSALEQYDLVHFATSAFQELYTAYLTRFSSQTLDVVRHRAACLGHIDCYNEPVRLGTSVNQHWVRTCFFFLPPSQVRALGTLTTIAARDGYFSGDAEAPFHPDAPLSERYRTYVLDWLRGADIGQGTTWHSADRLTAEGLASFEVKALCLFNEQMLAVRLRAMGCPLVDVTWLDTQLSAGQPVNLNTPWRGQLAARDRDRVYPSV